jgi:hypothetical protein
MPADSLYTSSVDSIVSVVNANETRYKLKQKDITGLSTEGGIIKAFYNQKDLKKLTVILYGEEGFSSESYYYNNGKLMYVFSQLSLYDKPFGEVKSISSNKYYYDNKRLVTWLNDEGEPVKTDNEQYKEAEKLMLYNSNNFVNFMRK